MATNGLERLEHLRLVLMAITPRALELVKKLADIKKQLKFGIKEFLGILTIQEYLTLEL